MSAHVQAPRQDSASILTKAFEVLRVFTPTRPVMTLTEIGEASGLPKSTAYRVLERLIELDAIVRHPVGYAVSLRLTEFGAITPAASGRDTALPHMLALHRVTGHTVNYGVLRGRDVVYLEKIERREAISTPSRSGSRLPANCTAIGKALLAWLSPSALAAALEDAPLPRLTMYSVTDPRALAAQLQTVRDGAPARERDEAQVGLSCAAAAVVVGGYALSAVSVSFPSDAERVEEIERWVAAVAHRIADDLKASIDHGKERWSPQPIE